MRNNYCALTKNRRVLNECVCVCSRYLDDVSLHHLINALCSLSLEAMEMAYGNNKVKPTTDDQEWTSATFLNLSTHTENGQNAQETVFTYSVCFLVLDSGAVSLRRGQAFGDRPCQHGSYRDPVETSDWPLTWGTVTSPQSYSPPGTTVSTFQNNHVSHAHTYSI